MTAGLVTGYRLRYAGLRRHTVNQAVGLQQELSKNMNQFSNTPDDQNTEGWEVGFVDGQLLPHGGSRELILAVADGDHDQARAELAKLPEPKRTQLGKIVQRLAPIVAATR
jgi:hypothetical protein